MNETTAAAAAAAATAFRIKEKSEENSRKAKMDGNVFRRAVVLMSHFSLANART